MPRPATAGPWPGRKWETTWEPWRTTTPPSAWTHAAPPRIAAGGASMAALGDPVKAMADFDTAISLDPGDPHAHFNKGCACMNLGDSLGLLESLKQDH